MRIVALIFIIFISTYNFSNIIIEEEVELKTDFIEVDNNGFLYVVIHDKVIKYNPKGLKIAVFQTLGNKKIYSLDVSNPFKIIAFFKDYNSIELIDNTLTTLSNSFSFDNFSNLQANLVCSSNSGGLWVLATEQNKLVKFHSNFKIDFEQSLFDSNLTKPLYMVDFAGFLYVLSENKEIYVYNQYGVFQKTIEVNDINSFQVDDMFIYYFDKNKNTFNTINKEDYKSEEIKVNDSLNMISIKTAGNNVYLKSTNKLYFAKMIEE